eukprot:scaffold36847_cov176-Amphora_coffeaeformis.AAC.2
MDEQTEWASFMVSTRGPKDIQPFDVNLLFRQTQPDDMTLTRHNSPGCKMKWFSRRQHKPRGEKAHGRLVGLHHQGINVHFQSRAGFNGYTKTSKGQHGTKGGCPTTGFTADNDDGQGIVLTPKKTMKQNVNRKKMSLVRLFQLQ